MKIGAARIAESDGRIHPTLGGLIFFGEYIDILNELSYFFLDYRERKSSDTRWTDRVCSGDANWSGNVYDFYFRIIDRLTADVKRPFELDDNLIRVEDTPVHKALRECLANALIHADYYGRQGVVIDKEFTKITFSNPGSFRIDVNEAITSGISDARNTRIFNMFALINVGERSGIGLCDVFNVWKKYGFSSPEIVETVSPDRVSISVSILTGENVANTNENVANVANHIGEQSVLKYVLNFISENPTTNTSEISKALGVNIRTVQRAIKELEEENILMKNGTRKSVLWTVLKK